MKKILSISLCITFILLSLFGCSKGADEKQTSKSVLFKAIDNANNTIESVEVKFSTNDNLIETLKNDVELEEKNGYVTSIVGVKESKENNLFWSYTLNGVEQSESLLDIELKNKDIIIFTLAEKNIDATQDVDTGSVKNITFKAIDNAENTIVDIKVEFDTNDNLIEKLKSDAQLEENNGFVTGIGGISQVESDSLYWVFTVNDSETTVGIKDIELNNGDVVVFTLTDFS